MKRLMVPALALLNAALAGFIALMPAVSEPAPPAIPDAVVPVRPSDASVVEQPVADHATAAETTMFGPDGAAENKAVGTPASSLSQPRADDMSLLGVLMAQGEGDRQSVVSLLRHGSPPIVSRLTLGGTLEGWKMVSATRTSVTLSGRDGTTRVLQVGAGVKDGAPR